MNLLQSLSDFITVMLVLQVNKIKGVKTLYTFPKTLL